MKKVVLILFLILVAVTGVFAQINTAPEDLRKELHTYIDAIPEENLYALKPLMSVLAGSPFYSYGELHALLDAVPERYIDAVKTLLLALADSPNNAMAGTDPPQTKTAEAEEPLPAVRVDTPKNKPDRLLSVGGGAFLDWSINNSVDISYIPVYGFDLRSFGVYAFLDAKYVELSIGPSFGIASWKIVGFTKDISLFQLDVHVLGKIPIDLSDGQFFFFPLLGLSYNHVLFGISGTNGLPMAFSDLGQLGVLGGVGLDVNLTGSLYLRSEGLFHFRFPFWSTMDVMGQPDVKINFGMGPRIKVAVGYRF